MYPAIPIANLEGLSHTLKFWNIAYHVKCYLILPERPTALYLKHSRGNLRRPAGVLHLQSATGSARGPTDGKAGNGKLRS